MIHYGASGRALDGRQPSGDAYRGGWSLHGGRFGGGLDRSRNKNINIEGVA